MPEDGCDCVSEDLKGKTPARGRGRNQLESRDAMDGYPAYLAFFLFAAATSSCTLTIALVAAGLGARPLIRVDPRILTADLLAYVGGRGVNRFLEFCLASRRGEIEAGRVDGVAESNLLDRRARPSGRRGCSPGPRRTHRDVPMSEPPAVVSVVFCAIAIPPTNPDASSPTAAIFRILLIN